MARIKEGDLASFVKRAVHPGQSLDPKNPHPGWEPFVITEEGALHTDRSKYDARGVIVGDGLKPEAIVDEGVVIEELTTTGEGIVIVSFAYSRADTRVGVRDRSIIAITKAIGSAEIPVFFLGTSLTPESRYASS